jgi:hypothetical protein
VKASLEDNRAHLRRQLLAKESEIQRLNVQLRVIIQWFIVLKNYIILIILYILKDFKSEI